MFDKVHVVSKLLVVKVQRMITYQFEFLFFSVPNAYNEKAFDVIDKDCVACSRRKWR